MKYIKTYESKVVDTEGFDKFFENYIRWKTSYLKPGEKYSSYYKNSLYKAKGYKIPEIFSEEFTIMDFFYSNTSWWKDSWGDKREQKKINNGIKNQVKQHVIKMLHKKFDEEPDSYFDLKEALDKRKNFNDRSSFDYIQEAAVSHIFMLFHKALKTSPFQRDVEKYNL